MNRRGALAILAGGLLAAMPACAQDFAGDVVGQLSRDGFREIAVSRTWLGRMRIVAHRGGGKREIILNPTTGEILRDLWLFRADESGASGRSPARSARTAEDGSSGQGSEDSSDDGQTDDGEDSEDDSDSDDDNDGQDDNESDDDRDEDAEDDKDEDREKDEDDDNSGKGNGSDD